MPRRLRLLWVTPHLPLRGIAASRERWWNLIARLAPRHDVSLLAFVDPEDAGREDELLPGLAAVHPVAKRPFRPDDPLALLPRTVAGGYCDPRLREAIAPRLAAERWDVVQYERSEMANLIPAAAPRAVLTVEWGMLVATRGGTRGGDPRWTTSGSVGEICASARGRARMAQAVALAAEANAASAPAFRHSVLVCSSPPGSASACPREPRGADRSRRHLRGRGRRQGPGRPAGP